MISDARRHGNENDLVSAFLNAEGRLLPKEKRCIYMEYAEVVGQKRFHLKVTKNPENRAQKASIDID